MGTSLPLPIQNLSLKIKISSQLNRKKRGAPQLKKKRRRALQLKRKRRQAPQLKRKRRQAPQLKRKRRRGVERTILASVFPAQTLCPSKDMACFEGKLGICFHYIVVLLPFLNLR